MTDSTRLQRTIQELLAAQPDDQRLADHLEGVVRDDAFPSLTWFWGPLLYERNRVIFRAVIMNHFSDWQRVKRRWRRIRWSEYETQLQRWLDQAEINRDTQLVRRLLRWKYANKTWGINHTAWNAAMLSEYQGAQSAATRALVLDKFDDWFEMDEQTAVAMYETDSASGKFILKHLPQTFWSGDKRKLWNQLIEIAQKNKDAELRGELYRRQVPIKLWGKDVLAIAQSVQDPKKLCDELSWRHPVGYGLGLSTTLIKLLESRGRDVMPYVQAKLKEIVSGWYGDPAKPFIQLAEKRGWWDLWTEAIRSDRNPKRFNNAVSELVSDRTIDESERIRRLRALAGVSREWNWGGFGLAQVHSLTDDVAVQLYQPYPDLVRECFKPNVTPRWWQGYPKLLAATRTRDDDEMVDVLASRYAAHVHHVYAYGKPNKAIVESIESLTEFFVSLRKQDPRAFALRAANVLTRIPTYTIHNYNQLLKTNSLARLLFVRSFESYLDVPQAVIDLVEGSDIHVQMLAYRVLAQDDDRARTLAAELLDILLGTLLRPLHRKTRLPAFQALAGAARVSEHAASRILSRARQATRLPDKNYPKEELVGLIAEILRHYPGLRGREEHPVVYRRQEAEA